jgi:periplasmic protein TonB
MKTTDASTVSPRYELRSELARRGLCAAEADPGRRLAWVNSIGLLFLLVGFAGSRPASSQVKALPPLEMVNAALVEPLQPPPQSQAEPQRQEPQSGQGQPGTPPFVVMTPEAPSIGFSVPAMANLVVPNSMAPAPPFAPFKPGIGVRNLAAVLNSTGTGGERPQPPYPRLALDQAQQGSVRLRLSADEGGHLRQVAVAQSSGSPVLDESARNFVRRHWTVGPGLRGRVYEATIIYQLQAN